MAKVTLTPEAARQFDRLPAVIKARLVGVMTRLERWPDVSGAKPLRGILAGRYRIRTGDYRVQFRIVADEIRIERIGHRDGFYED